MAQVLIQMVVIYQNTKVHALEMLHVRCVHVKSNHSLFHHLCQQRCIRLHWDRWIDRCYFDY